MKSEASVFPNNGSLLILPIKCSAAGVILVESSRSVKTPLKLCIAKEVSKVFTLSTTGRRSSPIDVPSFIFLQPEKNKENKKIELNERSKILLFTKISIMGYFVISCRFYDLKSTSRKIAIEL